MNTLQTRRSFVRSTALGAAIGWTAPSFLAATFDQLHAEAADRAIQTVTGKDSPILVVLQLAGGNDGLNTVVPFANDDYHRARPTLGLKPGQVLKLDSQFGLHPALAGLKSLYDAGQLGIVQAVGYPNPNRSHFRSTDIWMTATDSDRYGNLGWLGRYFDNACAGADPTVGVTIGRQSPLAFVAKKPTGVALENPDSYRFAEGEADGNSEMTGSTKFYREMNAQGSPTMAGGSVNMLGGSAAHTASPLDFLERTALDAQVSSEQIRKVAAKVKNHAEYPAARLATDLKLVAKLIAGGMPTRIYYVSQGGYDTHQGQANAHPRLLAELGDSLQAFLADLKAFGQLDRVLVLTFSEFGRRVGENASGGTDHGAAAPLFVMGGKVKLGLHGEAPSLRPGDLLNGDVKFRTDFRSVYAGVLENWLHTPSEPILGRQFAPLAMV
ncbi:MAG TPA: DUF1501 domain-containing protein [Candidatus Limnocylindria bacterium]|nr:DUF1501 domain-containing protein [Candidatus Limnocylindria bacterium]